MTPQELLNRFLDASKALSDCRQSVEDARAAENKAYSQYYEATQSLCLHIKAGNSVIMGDKVVTCLDDGGNGYVRVTDIVTI